MADSKTEWYFIVNPRAGSGKTMPLWVPAERKLQQYSVPFITAMTDHKRHATALAYEAASEGYRKIAAVGGDGSVHEALSGILKYCDETGTPSEDFHFGVFPIGSGNDWIKSIGVPHDIDKIIEIIRKDEFCTMDVVAVNSADDRRCYMANVGGTGFDSHVCLRVNAQKESGFRSKSIYLNALRYTIMHFNTNNIKVVADGQTVFEGVSYSVAVSNGRYSGSGLLQCPLADVDDGEIDYMIVPKVSLKTIVSHVPKLFNGTIHESGKVLSGRCRNLQIAPLDDASRDVIEVDGEIEGRLPASFIAEGRKINIIKY